MGRTQTVQRTGKDAKLITLLGSAIILGSIALVFVQSIPDHARYAVWGIVIGVAVRVYGRIVAWWKYR